MKNTYQVIEANLETGSNKTIVCTDENGEVSYIPCDLGNSDYQAYLESLAPKAKAPKVVDEATPE